MLTPSLAFAIAWPTRSANFSIQYASTTDVNNMKIQGQTLARDYSKVFELARPDGNSLLLRLQPLPLGFHRRLRTRGIVAPTPPVRIVRDSSGRPLRDERGLAIVREDEQDEHFLSTWEEYHQRVAVLVVAEAVHVDSTVEFDTALPTESENWQMYADNLYAELKEAGFTAGDLIQICEEVCKMSNLISEHIQAAQKSYLGAGN